VLKEKHVAHKDRLVAVIIIVVVLGALAYWITTADISAVNSPGRIESSIANGLRVVHRAGCKKGSGANHCEQCGEHFAGRSSVLYVLRAMPWNGRPEANANG